MGKGKGSLNHEPATEAYQRINFLYQASVALAQESTDSALPALYGHLAKQVTKKIVGKIHPDIKRSLCKACSNPLVDGPHGGTVKVVPFKKKRKNKRGKGTTPNTKTESETDNTDKMTQEGQAQEQSGTSTGPGNYGASDRISEKKSRPNRVKMTCLRCGYVRTLLQRPGYKLWIEHDAAFKS